MSSTWNDPPSTEDERDRIGDEAIDFVVRLNHGPPEAWPLFRLGQGRRDLVGVDEAGKILDGITAGRVPARNVAFVLFRLASWRLCVDRIETVLDRLPQGILAVEDVASVRVAIAEAR